MIVCSRYEVLSVVVDFKLTCSIRIGVEQEPPKMYKVGYLRTPGQALISPDYSRHSLAAELGDTDDHPQDLISSSLMGAFPTPPPRLSQQNSYFSQASFVTAQPSLQTQSSTVTMETIGPRPPLRPSESFSSDASFVTARPMYSTQGSTITFRNGRMTP